MKVSEMLRMLHDDGWYLVATKGSHRQLKHRTKPGRVTVAGKPNDDVAPGTLNRASSNKLGSNNEASMRYAIVIEKAANDYSAYVPDLPGCIAGWRNALPHSQRSVGSA